MLRSNYANVTQKLRKHYAMFTQRLRNVYAYITQNLRNNYAYITQILRKTITHITQFLRKRYAMFLRNDYANITQTLRIGYAKVFTQNTHNLRKYVYAGITQFSLFYAIVLRRNYAEITQIKYAFITHITQYYANNLRRYYANNLRKALRRLRNHYANKLRKCDYANTHNCITQITQMPIFVTQKFGSLHLQFNPVQTCAQYRAIHWQPLITQIIYAVITRTLRRYYAK